MFCIILFYSALLTVQGSIANLVLLITSSDSAKSEFLSLIAHFTKYAQLRNLPQEVIVRSLAFYEHQYTVLNGLDERSVCVIL